MTSESTQAPAAWAGTLASAVTSWAAATTQVLDLPRRARRVRAWPAVLRPARLRAAAARIVRCFRARAQAHAAEAEQAAAVLAAAPVYARTLPPPAAVQTLSEPRVSGNRISLTERIRAAYELADAPVAAMLAELGWQCG